MRCLDQATGTARWASEGKEATNSPQHLWGQTIQTQFLLPASTSRSVSHSFHFTDKDTEVLRKMK